MRIKNASLTEELSRKSVCLKSMDRFSEHEFTLLANYVPAPILGLALKLCSKELQRKVLAKVPREYAEQAYEILVKPVNEEDKAAARASEKVKKFIVRYAH